MFREIYFHAKEISEIIKKKKLDLLKSRNFFTTLDLSLLKVLSLYKEETFLGLNGSSMEYKFFNISPTMRSGTQIIKQVICYHNYLIIVNGDSITLWSLIIKSEKTKINVEGIEKLSLYKKKVFFIQRDSVYCWNLILSRFLRKYVVENDLISCYSLNKNLIAVGTKKGKIVIWNIKSPETPVKTISLQEYNSEITSILFENGILVCSIDKKIIKWGINEINETPIIEEQNSKILQLKQKGETLFCLNDSDIHCLNINTLKFIENYKPKKVNNTHVSNSVAEGSWIELYLNPPNKVIGVIHK